MQNTITKSLLALLVTSGIFFVFINREEFNAAGVEELVNSVRETGPLLFILCYALGTIFFVPGLIFSLAGGALFGPVWGTFYNITGATIGATFAFLISRYIASEWIAKRIGRRLKQLKAGVEGEGWRFVALTRLLPFLPFSIINYALGITRINLSHYIISTYLAILPTSAAFTYIGYAGREAAAGSAQLIPKVILALALFALIAFLPRLIARLRQEQPLDVFELKEKLENDEKLLLLDVRSTTDFKGKTGYIARSTNIPPGELAERIVELGEYEEILIALIVENNAQAERAAKLLLREGFAHVRVVTGGIQEWVRNGYPVKQYISSEHSIDA